MSEIQSFRFGIGLSRIAKKATHLELNSTPMFSFAKKKPKYEVKLFSEHERFYKEKFAQMQYAGWEIAGQMAIHVGNNGVDNYIFIPLKRKLK